MNVLFNYPLLLTNPKRFCFYKVVTWNRPHWQAWFYFRTPILVGAPFTPPSHILRTVLVPILCVLGIRYLQTCWVDDCLRLGKMAPNQHPIHWHIYSSIRKRIHTPIASAIFNKMDQSIYMYPGVSNHSSSFLPPHFKKLKISNWILISNVKLKITSKNVNIIFLQEPYNAVVKLAYRKPTPARTPELAFWLVDGFGHFSTRI